MFKKSFYYFSHWENWHWLAKYIIIGPVWLWLCLKARSFWFFTTANPTITFGGFTGETKSEVYRQLPRNSYPRTICVAPFYSMRSLQRKLDQSQLTFPLAVKPDAGMMGFMFRKVDSMEELERYHTSIRVNYVIQEWIPWPLEVSVFYYRMPGERSGHITGFVRKEMMEVTGDGRTSLRNLITNYPRARYRQSELFAKHSSRLDHVIPDGEVYVLSRALNLSRGGRLVSLEHEKDSRLLEVFDRLSNYSNNIYYGRYDIRCKSIEDLKRGVNYSILEFNGAGAEPHHVYGNGNSFFKACQILISHWNILYRISSRNRKLGHSPWSFLDGLRFSRRAQLHFSRLQRLDTKLDVERRYPDPGERTIFQHVRVLNHVANSNSLA